MDQAQSKSFVISKHVVWRAYELVKANKGAAGVDGQSLAAFEERLTDNLYTIWNRMSSGSYMPPPVRRVDIPKDSGGTRPLGIPTVGDRIAQMVVKLELEPLLEPVFHPWSFGYRPGRSALEAVGVARENCWKRSWVVDLDIKGFFDAIDHDLLMKAVRKHTQVPWHALYIARWLRAPVEHADGRLEDRQRGTPQGGVISPLLANLFLHYAFDAWMQRQHADMWFERYADDVICHCVSRDQAERLLESIRERFASCGLTLHPEKTRVVFCRDQRRSGTWPHTKFSFLGYEFRARYVLGPRGNRFVGFTPAISPAKVQAIRARFRGMTTRSQCVMSLAKVAAVMNPIIRGVYNYFGRYHRSVLQSQVGYFIDKRLMHWARRKYKSMRDSWQRTAAWLKRLRRNQPGLLAHWTRATG